MNTILEKEKVQELPDDHRQVLNVIINAPIKYITRDKILRQLGYEINNHNYRWLHSITSDLSIRYGYPIGSARTKDKRGYFIIETPEDKVLAYNTIYSIVEGNLKRLEAIKKLEV